MREVARGARHGEEHGEELGGEPQGAVHESAVKVHVRVQVAFDEVLVFSRFFFQRDRDVDERVPPDELEHLLGDFADHVRARVKVFVHAVAEPEHLLLFVLDASEERRDVLHRADPREHLEHSLVGAAVQGAVQRAHRARHRGVHVHPRARQMPRRGGGAVHLVLGV